MANRDQTPPKSDWDKFIDLMNEIWHFGGAEQSDRAKRVMALIGLIVLVVLLVSAFLCDAAAGAI